MNPRALRSVKRLAAEAADRAYGIRTNAQVSQGALGYDPDSDYLHYQASSWLSVPGVFSAWTPKPGPDDVVVDLGCGKGRAMVQIARRFKLKRIIGLEYAPPMAECARRNLERSRSHHKAAAFEVLEGDARTWAIPDDVTIVYIANPFVGEIFAGTLARIVESYDRRPRSLRIAYVHPIEHERVLATGRARELVRADARWMAWAGVDPDEFRRYEVIAPAAPDLGRA